MLTEALRHAFRLGLRKLGRNRPTEVVDQTDATAPDLFRGAGPWTERRLDFRAVLGGADGALPAMISLPKFFERRHRLRLTVTSAIAVAVATAVAIAIAIAGTANAAPAPAVAVANPIDVAGHANATPASKWDRLAQCESGGNWAADTANGFSGGLQFTRSTWRAYGGQGEAQTATRAEQITVAERVLADQGWDAWPACSATLGLR
jgi:hypothetical protein